MTAALQLYELIKRRYFEERWEQIFGDHLLTLYGQKKKIIPTVNTQFHS